MLIFYLQQTEIQLTPQQLFGTKQTLYFKPEQSRCPIDNELLHVLKTVPLRNIKAIGMGTFNAHQTILYCKKHPEHGCYKSEELATMTPQNSNVAYTVIERIGKLRFLENRQVNEIRNILFFKDSVQLSNREIELLIDKFIFYLSAVHQESAHLIKAQINAQGGYILHLDATCEGDSPKLVSSVDSVSGFVLYSAKVNSENADELAMFLKEINNNFGKPHAVVSDLSKTMKAAVKQEFADIPHFICHFHFVAVIGKLLFDKEHKFLYKTLSNAGISGKLKAMKLNMPKNFKKLSVDKIEQYLANPETLGKTAESTEILVYHLVLWILDHVSESNGYGFPFDQRYLNFYDRLLKAKVLLDKAKKTYSVSTDNDESVYKLYHLIEKSINDSALKKTVAQYKTKLKVFSDLRKALAVAPQSSTEGLRLKSETASLKELKRIQIAVEAFMENFENKIETTTDKSLKTSFINVKKRIHLYWDRLFADPFEVSVNGEKKLFFIHRTNNIMEQQFRAFAYSYRRIHGNHSIRRNLENIPAALPLVVNLKNPDYIKLVFQDESKIAERFSKVDINKIRAMAEKHYQIKKKKNSHKQKKLLRNPDLTEQLMAAFACVAK